MSGGAPKAITFTRPDPSEFVLLVAKTRGNGIVTGTETFKPAGTEWADDKDLRDAGYVPIAEVEKALRFMASQADVAGPELARLGTMKLLGIGSE